MHILAPDNGGRAALLLRRRVITFYDVLKTKQRVINISHSAHLLLK
jgi:hypothetical protein